VPRVLRWADTLLLGTAGLFLAGYLTTVVLQVFFRYVLEYALPWTEEVGVYLFVWSAFMAAAVVVGKNDHFSISLVSEWLGRTSERSLQVAITLLCLSYKRTPWLWCHLARFHCSSCPNPNPLPNGESITLTLAYVPQKSQLTVQATNNVLLSSPSITDMQAKLLVLADIPHHKHTCARILPASVARNHLDMDGGNSTACPSVMRDSGMVLSYPSFTLCEFRLRTC